MEGLGSHTNAMMDSTQFKLTELLKEVHLHHSSHFSRIVDNTVSAIKSCIDQIPLDFKVTADLAPKFVRDIAADKVDFIFKKPSLIEIGGSYSIQSLARPELSVDLIIRLPKGCFLEKDYLNYRYHAKRCLYLCLIKKYLEASPSIGKVAEVPGVFVRIIPSAMSLFSLSKLNMKRNNIHNSNHGAALQATPKYNSSILEDMFLEDTKFVSKSFLGWKEIREALVLFKVWARQRSSVYVHDCLNGFLISVILVYLASRQQISNSMKAIEIVRVTLNFIATSESWSRGLYFPKTGQSSITKELQDEAALTLKCMEKCKDGGFEEVFMTKIDYAVKYDYCMRLNLKGKKEVYASGFCLDDECWRLYEEKVHGILAKALNDRAKSIQVTWRNTQCQWSVNNGLSVLDKEPLFIGISVSTLEKAFRIVDIGPNAESKDEALEFRKFWGDKAELRRFKDGRIAESTVWGSEQWSRHLVLKRIVEHLQDEAALTLKCMEKCRDGGFEEVFMTKIDYAVKYDYCMRLNLKGKKEVYASGFCLDDECWRLYEEKVHGILAKALNDRAKSIQVTWRNTQCQWSVNNGLSVLDKEPFFIGISVSTLEKAFRIVDIGPNSESKDEALDFRKFWGDKAELRRFKDGRIAESTVWESEQWSRHLVLKRIAEHVIGRHLSLSMENIICAVDQLDFSLLHGAGDPVAYSVNLLGAFDLLSKRLRLIEGLPLKVSSVQPLDSAFRFTSVFPPEPHLLANEKIESLRLNKYVPSCIQPLEVMIQLEGSGNWPMDEIAIEKTKSSFLIQIGESLQKTWGMTCTATGNDVDVLTAGYAFRLKILHERGLNLLNKEAGSNQAKHVPSTDKKLLIRSQHASMINGLQSRCPIYGPVVRLAKRWVASHLFSACLLEEAVELFLRLLSQYDWTYSPLIVDINNDLSPSDEKEINDNFLLRRKDQGENGQSTEAGMFLATVYDKASESWTGLSPSVLELKRLVAYARSSANLLTKLTFEDEVGPYRWECLFRTPLSNYDAIILLHKDKLPYPQRLLFPSEADNGKMIARGHPSKSFQPFLLPKDLKSKPAEALKNKLFIDFDPSRLFIRDLEKEFSNTFKLWHDSLGGDVIGLTWRESSSSKKRKQEEDANEAHNPSKVLKAAGQVGKGFVRSIFFLKPPKPTN
ncbi:hypothetical protein PIB30_029504 [Stylosanthes scabra]|uniref:Nucleolar protein 6 n=1 Tax=Stylosanthes scabra TaxID=79078 RepID=A0ABU6TB26_9FABA|nr:hypothetical protein [Stylosanthes scabra]